MVEFNTGYAMDMDRGYNSGYGESRTGDTGTNDVGIAPIRDIGFSVPFGIAAANVAGIAAKIRTGARLIELQWPGAGKGQRNAQTPEMYGKTQRIVLEELSRINKVDFTTHASFNVMGLAGMDQNGNFSKLNKKFAIDEIRRAIDFAGDVARGGNVTVHTGEFQRPISEEAWAKDPKTGKLLFRNYEEEENRAIFRVIDERTGQVIAQARKNQDVARPVWKTAKAGETYIDFDRTKKVARKDEKIYINDDNERKPMSDRVAEFDSKEGRLKTVYWKWDDFKKEATERTNEARELWRIKNDPRSSEEERKRAREQLDNNYSIFKTAKSERDIEVLPEEAYVQATLETNRSNALGRARFYGENIEKLNEQRKKLLKAQQLYGQIETSTSPDEKWQLKRQMGALVPGLVPGESRLPSQIIQDQLDTINKNIEYTRQSSLSQQQQAKDTEEQIRNVQSHKRYGLAEAYDAYAEAGMAAMVKSDQIEKLGPGKLKSPIFVAMENIFPENYGGHPDELIGLVTKSRDRMTQKLMQERHYTESQARKEAEDHLKGHLDTGHLSMWRKYWVWDQKLTPEQNDKKFEDWALARVTDMAKKNLIGSVHLTDNLGYQDEHLSPGQGNTPTLKIVKILKDNGYKGPLVVEPGADATTDLSDFHGVMKTWRLFGSPIYGVGSGGTSPGSNRAWSDVQYGHFGKTEPPYFVFGQYSPSEDWTLWTGVPME